MSDDEPFYYGDLDLTKATPTLNDAFLRRAEKAVRCASAHLRAQPSAAASPVLRALLWASEDATSPRQADVSALSHATSEGSSGEAKLPAAAAATAATSVLVRRGVLGGGQKDPALARLEKRRAKQQSGGESTPSSSSTSTSTPAPAREGTAGPLPWTRRRLTDMTEMSWQTVRAQLGISIEVVQHRHAQPQQQQQQEETALAASPASRPATLHALFSRLGAPVRCWEEASLPYALGKSIAHRYELPTAVQCQCVPLITLPVTRQAHTGTRVTEPGRTSRHGFDVLVVADTGSGKTAGYLVPLLAQLVRDRPRLLGHEERIALGPQALVLVPTRELAEQVLMEVQALLQCPVSASALVVDASQSSTLKAWDEEGRQHHKTAPTTTTDESGVEQLDDRNRLCELRVVKLVGGDDRDAQYEALARGAHLVIGTVGQLHSLLDDRFLSLGNTTTVVMDEADRMIAEHLKESLVGVLQRCPVPRQTLLFTATMGPECAEIAKSYLSPSGYLLLRTSTGCASICQSFEVFPTRVLKRSTVPAAPSAAAAPSASSVAPPLAEGQTAANERKRGRQGTASDRAQNSAAATQGLHRALDPHIHPEKFARLVTWLVYAGRKGRAVVFANTKATCDALQEELEKEFTHLQEQSDAQSLELLIGDAPAGLFFTESTPRADGSGGGGRARVPADNEPGLTHGQLCLENLTSTAVVHSGLSRVERERLVGAFRQGQRRVLLTTDLLARGLDVSGVSLVISYDAPRSFVEDDKKKKTAGDRDEDEEAVRQYEHRIGRTGRAGATGVAVSFLCVPEPLLTRAAQSRAAAAKARRTGNASTFEWPDDNDDGARLGVDSDGEEEKDDNEEGQDGEDGSSRSRARRLETRNGGGASAPSSSSSPPAASLYNVFPSDEPILRPLWRFLLHCVETNDTLRPSAMPPLSAHTDPKRTDDDKEKRKTKDGDSEDQDGERRLDVMEAIGKRGHSTRPAFEAVLHLNRYPKVHLADTLAELLFQTTRHSRYGSLTK